jgi:hypothetical protein
MLPILVGEKGSMPMRNLIRRITAKLSSHEPHPERSEAPHRSAIVQMMVCDLSNIDSLARALGEHRR